MGLKNNEISLYLENLLLLILGIFFLIFPVIFTPLTTDPFSMPKQIFLGATVLLSFLLFGAKMISEGSVRIRKTPYDLSIFLFAVFLFVSALFSQNRFDSLISYAPVLFAMLAYYLIVNTAKNKSSVLFLLFSLIGGAFIASLIATLSFLKIFILPYAFTHFTSFTSFGSLLDQGIYLVLVLPTAIYLSLPLLKAGSLKEVKGKEVGALVCSVFISIGLLITVYQLLSTQKPFILPFETGFQTAFASISQDAGRIAQGFLFGSGYGTYAADFTKFKQAAFNQNTQLWALTFFKSSNHILELLATAGILGFLSYLYLIIKIIKNEATTRRISENPFFIALALTIIGSFIYPLSFTGQTLFFILLGLFAAAQGLVSVSDLKKAKFYDIELHFVFFKNGIIPLEGMPITENSNPMKGLNKEEKSYTRFLPITFFVAILIFVGIIGYYLERYVSSDLIFQNSLVAASSNNGLETYNNQVNAIGIFPYRDAYHRIYSQTNLALANSLAAQQPKGSTPSAQVQQTIYTLIQQSINSARSAASISPLTVANWQNLSSVYRSLIGFGQNAENFAIITNQQAIALDPNNPQEYINLGGIYYQLGQWDNAQRQFQIAISLKPDLANAYYNLGHALESKGDYVNALTQYQTVLSLVTNDKAGLQKMTDEINALQKKLGSAQQASRNQAEASSGDQPPLGISTPANQLPEQKKQVKIPAPSTAPIPTTTVSPKVSPTPSVKISPTETP